MVAQIVAYAVAAAVEPQVEQWEKHLMCVIPQIHPYLVSTAQQHRLSLFSAQGQWLNKENGQVLFR